MKKMIAVALFGLGLITAGCAARTGPIRGESSVEGDSTSVSGRGQVNRDTQTTEESRKKSTTGTASGSSTGSGGAVSGSATGSGTGSVSGSGTVIR